MHLAGLGSGSAFERVALGLNEHLGQQDWGKGFSAFSQYLCEDRVDLVCSKSVAPNLEYSIYLERLGKEIREVNRGNFWGTLCFAASVVGLAKRAPSIPFVCRGSAGSSLLCYLAGISDIDPIEEGLTFERFLGGGRDRSPDVDLDFPREARALLWARIREVYGDSIGFVATRLKYRTRGAIREALRRCGVTYEAWVSDLALISSDQRERVLRLASSLEGKEYGLARHCGGIVYFPNHLSPPPQYCTARTRDPFVQLLLDKDDLGVAGLSKLDILSNYGLSHLRAMGLENLLGKDANDAKTGQLFSSGDTWGIVQAESPAMRKIFLNLGFSTLKGVTLALGLVRPATGGGFGKPSAVGRNPIERRLIYEDDITEFLSIVLGSSASLAEFSRRTLAKGGDEARRLLVDMERIVGRKSRGRVTFRGREWTWSEIKRQLGLASSYAFCRAHATSYGRLVWALGFAKVHYPELFWSNFIPTVMASSMYLPWVYFERIKAHLDVEVVWPGDLGLSVGKFFSYPWVVRAGKFIPCLSSDSITTFGEDWGNTRDVWLRQLKAVGFWAGRRGPIERTYLDSYTKDEFNFHALRALKTVRYHPLDKKRICLFETLGFGSLKVLEYSRILERGFEPQSQLKGRGIFAEGLFVSGRGKGSSKKKGNCYYLSSNV
jgi:hypothetical protein